MKKIFLLLFLMSCAENSVRVTQINQVEYILTCNGFDSCKQPLLNRAKQLCPSFTIVNMSGNKYGDINNIHINCVAL